MSANLLEALRDGQVGDLLPRELAQQLEALGLRDVTTTDHGDVEVVRATVLPLADRGLPAVNGLPVEAPGLTSGLRAQLAIERPGGGAATRWAVDLDLDRVSIRVPGLRPAREAQRPAQPTILLEDPARAAVRIVGRGVLRISASSGGAPEVSLIDRLDEVDPFGSHGAVTTVGFEPPSFLVGSSSFGFTVDEMAYDASASISPAPKPPGWRGMALRRATLFLPPGAPVVGDVSLGVRDVFLGDPVGVEGTAFLEFGGPGEAAAPVVEQQAAAGWESLAVATTPDPGSVKVELKGEQPPAAHLRARLGTAPPAGTAVSWRLGGNPVDPESFEARPGDVLEVRVGDLAPTRCLFTGTLAAAPTIRLELGPNAWDEVASITATGSDLGAAAFTHTSPAGGGSWQWRWDEGAADGAASVGVPAGLEVGMHELELLRDGRPVRRVRVELRARGPALVGCRAGTFTTGAAGTGTAVSVLEVAGTYSLVPWQAEGRLVAAQPPAAPGTPPAAGTIAEVVTAAAISTDGTSSTTPKPPPEPLTHLGARFVYDSDELSPRDQVWTGEDSTLALDQLADALRGLGPGAKFAVVGRCDDLATVGIDATTDTHNRNLAERRAARGRQLLIDREVDPARIAWRGEQSPWASPPAASAALPPEADTQAWLARSTPEYKQWDRPYPRDDWHRVALRRADIYVYDAEPQVGATMAATDLETMGPAQQRALVPGADLSVVSGSVVSAPVRGRPRFRVRAEVEWNDPTARGIGEAIPSRAEVTVQWPGTEVALPGGRTAAVTKPGNPPGGLPVWTLRGRWSHDRSAGSDDFTLSLDVAGSDGGIAQVVDAPLAGGMGMEPAVIGAAGSPTGGDTALVGALIAALGLASTALLRDESRTVVTGITIDHLQRKSGSGSRTRLTVDYTVELSVQVSGALPLRVSTRPGRPMKLRYRGVGVEVDTAAPHWYEGVGLVIGNAVPEVVDPGSWQLGPPLDDLLRVLGVRSGASSGWIEVDLALSVDLGVVKLSTATVRIAFGSGGIEGLELRGLRAAVDIPGTLRGEGALDVGDGTIQAGLELDVIPLKLAALANLALGPNGFVELGIGLRFPAPIPFANSGLGLFGVAGRFVSNGRRALDAGNPDPVERELTWLAKPAPKYWPEREQFALGLGAVVGTVPDSGFTFHALGMVTVEFPRPAVIFGVIAKVLSEPAPVPAERADRPGGGLSVIGLVVVDDRAVTIALRGHYELPGLVILDMPVGAWFPYADPTASWVHVGTDGQPGREGSPVTIRLLPDVLDVRVWAFVMVQGKGIAPGLMGKPDFVFDGFSIGFGAGWEIDWSAGPIRLQASALVLAGFGANPLRLAAGIWVRGFLDLVVLSISARGELKLLTDGRATDLHGEFCGEVDCFFFSIEGCVGIDISATLGGPQPPSSPLTGVDLVSRLGYATAKAVRSGAGDAPRVWPDTIPVLHFAHTVGARNVAGDFQIGTPMPGPVWSGSRDLKYAFRITEVRLEAEDGTPFHPPAGTTFDTAWWWPGVRSTTAPSQLLSAAGSETRDLALLSWEPWTGLLPLSEPKGSPGDPATLIGELCYPVQVAEGACAIGELGRPAGVGIAILFEPPEAAEKAGMSPLRLRLSQPADAGWEEVLATAGASFAAVSPAGVVPLDQSFTLPSGRDLYSGWRLAGLSRGGQPLGSLSALGTFDPPLEEASLVLEACPVRIEDDRFSALEVPRVCVDLERLDLEELKRGTDEEGVVHWEGLRLAARSGERLEVVEVEKGIWALLVPENGLAISPSGQVTSVAVRFAERAKAKLVALSVDGEEIGAEGSGGEEVTLQADGIATALVFAAGALVSRICTADPIGASSELLSWDPRKSDPTLPEVVGVHADGTEERWEPSTRGERGCLQVRYEAPASGSWAGVRIGPARGFEVTVISACGIRWQQAFAHAYANRHRAEAIEAIGSHASGPAGTVRSVVEGFASISAGLSGPPPRPLLAADKAYRVSVSWEWQSWTRDGGAAEPGPPDAAAWRPGGTDVFRFATAAAAPSTPVDLIGERSFDPRSTARYVTGAQPSGELPHFLDDPIRVTFSIDYLPALLKAYGYEAFIEVRPTDVAPGSQQATPHPPNVVKNVVLLTWVEGVLRPVEERVVEAVDSSPCITATGLGGLAAVVRAGLAPETAYDLLFLARPSSGGDRVISRSHFRTSRYGDVDELLRAMGLADGVPSAIAPADVLLESWPSLPPAIHDDAAFDAALAALGLDPWPLATEPRTTTLWVPPDAARPAWGLAGVLLEAPEPIARRDRVTVSGAVGPTPLAHLRSRANGTQVLLAPAAPVAPAPIDALSVNLSDALRGRVAQGGALLLGGPRTIRREVE